ncbi:MAG: hypothetical protein H8E71_06240 [Candidatus Marinimicrobia bacterium]|nr:hypothetical protein [Candidatus Neomarinimicrobiota bacterium]MBL7109684.1 hypothetical protein [Candidatus Neomarinimicrobiota bacterium]
MNVSNYIIEKSEILFGALIGEPIRIDIVQKRFTSIINFCKVHFEDGSFKNILVKYYDDNYSTRLTSLQREYNLSHKHQDIFNTEGTGIPRYIHFDSESELVVIEYIDNSLTLEKTLLKTHKLYRPKTLDKIFFNTGLWLSKLHSINIKLDSYTLSKYNLQKELKTKWISVFNNKEEIQNDIKFLINNVITERRKCDVSLLHKEYAPGNILHVKDRVYGIDFGTPEQGCVLDDLAYFIVSSFVLNKYPKYPFSKRIKFNSDEINSFIQGYCSNSNTSIEIFNTHLFQYFLYKNLLRRISSQLIQADCFSKSISIFIKPIIYRIFYHLRTNILHYPKYTVTN